MNSTRCQASIGKRLVMSIGSMVMDLNSLELDARKRGIGKFCRSPAVMLNELDFVGKSI